MTAPVVHGAISIDANISKDQPAASTTVATPAFTTTAGNELLLAFIATDYLSGANTTVASVSGGGLTWALVVRSNTQSGTSEIWRAFSSAPLNGVSVTATLSNSVVSAITVMSFSGVDTSGANGAGAIGATARGNARSGAPTASLVTTRDNSWVFGVGNDFDNPIARTPAAGQTLVHQYLTPTGDTYWVQMQNSPAPITGTTVRINDTAPASDRYNLSICEILPAVSSGPPTWTISGTISGGGGATVALGGVATATTTADASGNYSFTGLANGSYTVTPAKAGYTFTPATESVTINGANATAVNFTAQPPPTWSISGVITGVSGATVALGGAATATTTTDASGNYSFTNLANGSYTVTPAKGGYTFTPATQSVTINGGNSTANFTAQALPTWSISGVITNGSGANVALGGAATGTTTADASGNYSFTGLANGSYTVTPGEAGYTFTPATQPVTINGVNVTGINFTAQATQSSGIGLDVNTSADRPTASSSVSTSTFSTVAGNELLLAFIATDYLSGANTTVTNVTGGGLAWVLVKRTNAQRGTAEIWRAFSAAPLSNVSVTATLSQSVISSITLMSFTGVDLTGVNGSGAIGAIASGSAASGSPSASLITTRNNSWIIGVGNDFDNAIARTPATGQHLVHQYLTPAGDTYWVQMPNSPIPASGTNVIIADTVPAGDQYNLSICELLSASAAVVDTTPPTVSMSSPAQGGTVASLSTLWAVASDNVAVAGVQFLLDGAALGAEVTSAPYSMTWNSTAVANGAHTIAARARDTAGLTATSTVTINVDNTGNPAIVGAWSSVVNIPAVAVNLILLKNNKLLLYQDGATPTVWDYINGTFTNVATSADLFCSGHALLADGRVLVVGGFGGSGSNFGISSAAIFDPAINSWTSIPNMKYKRWYPTATTLSDGRIIVMAGWQTGSHTNAGIPEIYNPSTNSWTQLTNANNPFETYPFIFQLADGRLIHVGGSEYATVTDILDLGTQTWSVVDSNIVDGGSATMYTPGKIMKAGSATDSQGVGPSSNTTYTLDMTQASPAWKQTPSMAYARSFLNVVTLPDGSVLAVGGESDKDGGKLANAVYAAELWSPTTQTWTTMASMHTPREYHSTALLLPDGRVLVSGMGADFGNVTDEMNAEFYSPPYLFKGPRPTITQASAQVQHGTNFFVGTPDGPNITSAVLIRTGAVTHFFDQNTRSVPVSFQQTTGGLNVSAPASLNVTPPGYYMLFLVNSAGVPSIGSFLQIQ